MLALQPAGPPADIFSPSATIMYLHSGRPPFRGGTLPARIAAGILAAISHVASLT